MKGLVWLGVQLWKAGWENMSSPCLLCLLCSLFSWDKCLADSHSSAVLALAQCQRVPYWGSLCQFGKLDQVFIFFSYLLYGTLYFFLSLSHIAKPWRHFFSYPTCVSALKQKGFKSSSRGLYVWSFFLEKHCISLPLSSDNAIENRCYKCRL